MSQLSRRPSPPSRVICRPAGPGGDDVYSSFAEANAARLAAGPGAVLLLDGDVTAEAIAHNFTNMRIVGLGGGVPTVTFPDGASAIWDSSALPVDFEMINTAFAWEGTTAVFIDSPASGLYVLVDLYSSIATLPGASKSFIHAAAGIFVEIEVDRGSAIKGSSGRPIVSLATGGAGCQMFFGRRTTLNSNSITGGDASAYTVTDDTAGLMGAGTVATINRSQTGATPLWDPA